MGDMLTPGSTDTRKYDHYSIHRLVDNWKFLGTLRHHDADELDDGFGVFFPPPIAPEPHPEQEEPAPTPKTPHEYFTNNTMTEDHLIEMGGGASFLFIIIASGLFLGCTEKGRAGVARLLGRGLPPNLIEKTGEANDSDDVVDLSSESDSFGSGSGSGLDSSISS